MLKSLRALQPEDNTSNNKNGKNTLKSMIKLLRGYITLKSYLIRCRHQYTASLPLRLRRVNADAIFTTRQFNWKITPTIRLSWDVKLICTLQVNLPILSGKTGTSVLSRDSLDQSLCAWFSSEFSAAHSFWSTLHRKPLWLWNKSIQRFLADPFLKSMINVAKLGWETPSMSTLLTQP